MRTPGKKANGKWRIRFLDAHGVGRSATYATKREAEAALSDKRAALAAGLDPGRVVRFDELVKEWTESHLTHGLRPSSVKDYKQALVRMSAQFGAREVRRIGAGDLERCRNELVRTVVAERTAKFERVLAGQWLSPRRSAPTPTAASSSAKPRSRGDPVRRHPRGGEGRGYGADTLEVRGQPRLRSAQHRGGREEAGRAAAGGAGSDRREHTQPR